MSSIRTKKNIVERKKKALIRIGVTAGVLVALCAASALSDDRTAPVFDFTGAASVINVESGREIEYSSLINGIKATDKVDGDLTDDIVIKSVRKNADSSLSVIYFVRDHSGNVSSEERIYNLSGDIASDDDKKPSELETHEPESENTSSEEEETTSSIEEESTEIPDTEAPSETAPPVEDTQPETVPPSTGSEKPVIILNTGEAHVPVGGFFNYPAYIQEMWDDVDDQDYLYQSIWIENYELVDWSKPGVYTLVFRIVDSDKNISDGQVLTLYVE